MTHYNVISILLIFWLVFDIPHCSVYYSFHPTHCLVSLSNNVVILWSIDKPIQESSIWNLKPTHSSHISTESMSNSVLDHIGSIEDCTSEWMIDQNRNLRNTESICFISELIIMILNVICMISKSTLL